MDAKLSNSQAKSGRRPRWRLALGVGFGVLAMLTLILAGAAYFERMRVATLIVQRYLASYGIESEVEFGRLGWSGFLVRVRAGPADAPELTVEGADVTLIYPDRSLVGQV